MPVRSVRSQKADDEMKIFANRKTKVAHADSKRGDSCRQGFLLKQNISKFETLGLAKAAGYRACKRCRPE